MGAVLMAWGPHRFEVGAVAYEDLHHRVAGRWERHPIIGRRPAGQYVGPDEEAVVLRGTIYPIDQGGGLAGRVSALLASSRAGEVHTLLAVTGDVMGPYRLEKAEAAESYHLPSGAAQKVTYDLEFHAHDDGDGQIWSLWP